MLLRGIFPKLYRRRVNLDRHIESAVEATSRVITLVETLQINRLSAFWWSCEYSTNLVWEKTLIVMTNRLGVQSCPCRHFHGQSEAPFD